jgi:hypothetical protein
LDISEHRPRRSPSKKWRELIKKVWEADPMLCPKCSREMRIVALIDEREVIERILRHLGLWEEGVRLNPARAPPDGQDANLEKTPLSNTFFAMKSLTRTAPTGAYPNCLKGDFLSVIRFQSCN